MPRHPHGHTGSSRVGQRAGGAGETLRAFVVVFMGRDRRGRVRGLRVGWLEWLQLWGPGAAPNWSLPWVIRAGDSGSECENPIEGVVGLYVGSGWGGLYVHPRANHLLSLGIGWPWEGHFLQSQPEFRCQAGETRG